MKNTKKNKVIGINKLGNKEISFSKLNEQYCLLKKTQKIAKLAFYNWDLKINEVELSEEFFNIYGITKNAKFSPNDFIRKFIHHEDIDFVQENLDLAIRGIKDYNVQHRIVQPDGNIIWVHSYAELSYDDNNQPSKFLGVSIDITESKKVEIALKETQERFKNLYNSIRDAILITDTNRNIIDCNPAFTSLFNYSKNEILGEKTKFIYKDEEEFIKVGDAIREQYNNGIYPFIDIVKYKKKDGNIFFGETGLFSLRNNNQEIIGYIGLIRDISKRLETEKEVNMLSQVIKTSPQFVVITNTNGIVTFINDALLERSNFKKEEIIGNKMFAFTDEAGAKLLQEEVIPALFSKGIWRGEINVAEQGNKYFPAFLNCSLLSDDKGEAESFVAVFEDISERKKVEKKLLNSEEKFRNLIEFSPIAMFIHQGDKFVYVNKSFEQQTGYKQRELLKLNFLELVHPDDKDIVKERASKRLKFEDVPQRYELKIIDKKGKIKWADFYGIIIDFDDQPAILGFAYDITERKLAEIALKESEEKYRILIEQMEDGIIQVDLNDYIQFVNPRFCELVGYSQEELIGEIGYELLLYDEDKEKIKEKSLTRPENLYDQYELRMKKKNGETIHFLMSVSAIKNQNDTVIGSMAICTDITERKLMEKKLKESEETYRNLFQNAQVGLFRTSIKDGKTLECNSKIADMFGYDSREEAIEKYRTSENYVDPGAREKMLAELQKRGEVSNYIAKFYRKDKSILWTRYSAKLYPEKGWLEGVAEDITEQKEIEEKLRLSEKKFRSFFEDDVSGNFISTNEGKLLDCNLAFVNVFDFRNKEHALNTNMYDLYPDKLKRKNKIDLLRKKGKLINYEEKMRTITGKSIIVLSNIVAEKNKNGEFIGFKGYIIDITQQKKAEEELRKLSKLESLGILAGGIAHNIKNILAGISLNAGLIKIKPEQSEKYIDNIEKAIDQATVLANRFQTFATGGEPIKETISIRDVIDNTVSIALSGTKASCVLNFSDDLWNIQADSKQLNEVFTNLFINAIDAMPKGGTIKITAENYIKTDTDSSLKEGIYVKISVQDEGIGIPDNIIKNIFDPFFTTKAQGRGLGLSSIYYIIQRHNGFISVDSVVGKGTRFDIYLPATDENIIISKKEKSEIIHGKNKRILYMDDEEVLRENISDIIELLDYEIDTAKDGYEAIGLYKKSIEKNNKYDVVILDLTIQGSDLQGEDVLKELIKLDTDVKAIVFSGHSALPIVANYQDYGFAGRLEKPVSIEKLSKVLDNIT